MLGRSVPSCSGLRPAGQGESSAGKRSDRASLLVLGGPGEEGRLARESQQLAPAPGAAWLTSTRPDFAGGRGEPDIGVFM